MSRIDDTKSLLSLALIKIPGLALDMPELASMIQALPDAADGGQAPELGPELSALVYDLRTLAGLCRGLSDLAVLDAFLDDHPDPDGFGFVGAAALEVAGALGFAVPLVVPFQRGVRPVAAAPVPVAGPEPPDQDAFWAKERAKRRRWETDARRRLELEKAAKDIELIEITPEFEGAKVAIDDELADFMGLNKGDDLLEVLGVDRG
jgi:hypothetical protein